MTKKKLIKKALSVDVLVLDGGTQSRVAISEVTVEEYTEVLASGGIRWPFPPLDIFHDVQGSQYLVADGFHRLLAALRHGRASVPCIIHQGTAWDALLFGMSSNQEHGLRTTQADKRHSVELLLDSGNKLTQQQIADMVGVVRQTVARIVAERKSENVTLLHSSVPVVNDSDSDDPFEVEPYVDPFGEEGEGEDGRTESDGQDGHQEELPPRPPRKGTEGSGGSSPPKKKDEFKIQRSKTIKTAEALVRAFDDLNRIRKSSVHEMTISECQALIVRAKNWK